MRLTKQYPSPGDSDSALIWKYAINLYLQAVVLNPALTPPRLGSPQNELWTKAITYANTLN